MHTGSRWFTAALAGLAALLLAAPAALAHPQGTLSIPGGLSSGLLHPLTGLDHLLAMLAVGLWAAQRGGRERAWLPAAFVGAMVAGGVLALIGLPLPGVELGIALSVLALGALVVATPLLPRWAALGLVLLAGVLHGHAHGTELIPGLSPALYAAGFVVATAALHALGVLLATGLLRMRTGAGAVTLRAGGAAIALAGVVLVAGLL
jgi:urease accessory protein